MNITGKFLKVWKLKTDKIKTVDLGDSQKNKDGDYVNCTWFGCCLFGKAASIEVKENDTIEVLSGLIFMEKYNDKWYPKVKIFDFAVTKSGNDNNVPEPDNSIASDDLPF